MIDTPQKQTPTQFVPFDFSSYLYSNVLSDVEFIFPNNNNETICAHRLILCVGSPAFKTMFEGKINKQITKIINK
jgi:hypothetical protein